jgi:hypothetical protein
MQHDGILLGATYAYRPMGGLILCLNIKHRIFLENRRKAQCGARLTLIDDFRMIQEYQKYQRMLSKASQIHFLNSFVLCLTPSIA